MNFNGRINRIKDILDCVAIFMLRAIFFVVGVFCLCKFYSNSKIGLDATAISYLAAALFALLLVMFHKIKAISALGITLEMLDKKIDEANRITKRIDGLTLANAKIASITAGGANILGGDLRGSIVILSHLNSILSDLKMSQDEIRGIVNPLIRRIIQIVCEKIVISLDRRGLSVSIQLVRRELPSMSIQKMIDCLDGICGLINVDIFEQAPLFLSEIRRVQGVLKRLYESGQLSNEDDLRSEVLSIL